MKNAAQPELEVQRAGPGTTCSCSGNVPRPHLEPVHLDSQAGAGLDVPGRELRAASSMGERSRAGAAFCTEAAPSAGPESRREAGALPGRGAAAFPLSLVFLREGAAV